MSEEYTNDIDNNVDTELYSCINIDAPKSFFLFAGAGSGKTRSLINVLKYIKDKWGTQLTLSHKKVAVITYTNAACEEIKRRLDFTTLFTVSTIHSFVWDVIKSHQYDIKVSLKKRLSDDILDLESKQAKVKTPNKTSISRAKKIADKKRRLDSLDSIKKFTYNPNGENNEKDSLSHAEVISISSELLSQKVLLQKILIQTYPILLIDESQDTKEELIDTFFLVQSQYKQHFALGLFGDVKQRIYAYGKNNLGTELPEDWIKPAKALNHRSPKRIVELINKIAINLNDPYPQKPRTDAENGFVRLFVVNNAGSLAKQQIEKSVIEMMEKETNDSLWNNDSDNVKVLILEHHMAAQRMGFFELFTPLYQVDKLKTGLLDGTLAELKFFTQIILPIIEANKNNNQFEVTNIIKKYSPLFSKNSFKESKNQLDIIKNANEATKQLLQLWENQSDPTIRSIVENINKTGLLILPHTFSIIINDLKQTAVDSDSEIDEQDDLSAWDEVLAVPFSQLSSYNSYISGASRFDTHQGVKGLEFERVMAVIDDNEAKGFMFSYDKLFGVKGLSDTDLKNSLESKDTSIERTLRLFYVICSRAVKSLAIIAYSSDPEKIKETVIANNWFELSEISILN